MNGLRTSLRRCRRPYEAGPEDNHVSGPFFNFRKRRRLKIESLAPPAARCGSDGELSPKRTKARQRGQRMTYRGKKTACAPNGIKDGRRRINSVDGRFRPKSAKIRMRFCFRRAEEASMPTGSRVKACSSLQRMRFYAPYAVPLKGKGRKRSNSQKRCIKCIRLL